MNRKLIIVISVLIVLISFVLCFKIFNSEKEESVDDIDISIKYDNSSLDFSKYEEKIVNLETSLNIDKGGVYRLSGSLLNGNITINTSDNVKLIFDGVNIRNSNGPAVMIEEAKNTLIYLENNSENYLEDGNNYVNFDEEVDAVIYSKDDLIFDGEGTLTIKANYKNGIVSKDDLSILEGNYNIESEDDAIKGKDSVYIVTGNFNINSKGDGVKSTNTQDDKGSILIKDGKFLIVSDLDGIQASGDFMIENGEFDITTGGVYINNSNSKTWGIWGNSKNSLDKSAKGIKSDKSIIIKNGLFKINSSDDSIHSNRSIGISGGEFNISSGDDAVHADDKLIIDGGNIEIIESYEGLEASNIVINDGKLNINSRDDGINVAGGNDSSSMNRPGQNNFSVSSNNKLIINGGNIYVNASGDGIDSNGNIYVYDGIIYVDGPSDGSNSALDYDGEFIMDGGTLIAVDYKDMAQGISDKSKQHNVILYLDNIYNGGVISLVDEEGLVLETYTSSKSFNSVVISTNRLIKSNNYKLEINGEEIESFKVENISTVIGNNFNSSRGPGGRNSRR